MRRLTLLAAAAGTALALLPSQANAFDCDRTLDNFNRADSSDLGADWTEQVGDFAIQGNQVGSTDGLMTFNGQTAAAACVDATATGGVYVAIVLGYAGVNDNLFLKVQDNSGTDGTFDRAYFYYGDNGNPWSDPFLFDLTPFTTGRIYAALAGDTAILEVDTDFDNAPEESFSVPNVPLVGLGSQIGLGNLGNAPMDNFAVPTCKGKPVTVVADGGRTPGTGEADSIGGSEGKDKILARGGKDRACGEDGKDRLSGGGANDKLSGGAGKDRLKGGAGKDRLSCGRGRRDVAIADRNDKVARSCEIVR